MPVGLGSRFLIEAGFLIAVAIVAGLERLRTLTIVLVMAGAWALVALVEWLVARRRPQPARGAQAGHAVEPAAPAAPQASAQARPAVVSSQQEPQPAPAPEKSPRPAPEPRPEPTPLEPLRPRPEPAPEPPPLAALAELPEPEPAADAEPQAPVPEPEPQVVSLAARSSAPRAWNLWDLERIARDQSGSDVARDEERAYVLMYLREFANADGVLPPDFDGLVRESFGDVLDAAYT